MAKSKSSSQTISQLLQLSPATRSLNIAFFSSSQKQFVFLPVTSVLSIHPVAGSKKEQVKFFFLPNFLLSDNFYNSFANYQSQFPNFFLQSKNSLFFNQPIAIETLILAQSVFPEFSIQKNFKTWNRKPKTFKTIKLKPRKLKSRTSKPQKLKFVTPKPLVNKKQSPEINIQPKKTLVLPIKKPKKIKKKLSKKKKFSFSALKKQPQRQLLIDLFAIPRREFFFVPVTSLLSMAPISITKNSSIKTWNFVVLLKDASLSSKILPHLHKIIQVEKGQLKLAKNDYSFLKFSPSFPKPLVSKKILPDIVFRTKKNETLPIIKPTSDQLVLGQELLPLLKNKTSLNIAFGKKLNTDFFFLPVDSILTKYPAAANRQNRSLFLNLNYFEDHHFFYKFLNDNFEQLANLKLFEIRIKDIIFRPLPLASSLKKVPQFATEKPFFDLLNFKEYEPKPPSTFFVRNFSWSRIFSSIFLFWRSSKDKNERPTYHNYDNADLYGPQIKSLGEYNWNNRQYQTLRYRQKTKANKINEQLLVTALQPSPEKYVIELENISKYYMVERNVTKVFHNISLKIKWGEFVVVLGPSGSGKTTLLNVMSGLDSADTGDVLVAGQNLTLMNNSALTSFRRHNVGIIFQSYNLLQNLTARENIEIGAYLASSEKKTIPIDDLMDILEINELADSYSYQLSGGQQQRFSIARAIAKNPNLLFCDEPTGALDQKMSRKVLKTLMMIKQRYKTTIVLITHNEKFAQIADTVIRFKDGKVTKIDTNENKLPISKLEI